ncbi:probable beta-1,3-galactosyltransferase 14 [Zingiber officinale]|uniref:probable beta-1,3-galactosyltransferase 14 n=1 Tax=Zingiber officinale TaxID=94328 RepID=UPI001C4D7555|nr:probable beta-1,3-galactosyltransferase 14 [Zingiber officinale]
MPMSPKVFHSRPTSRFRRLSSSVFSLACLIFGITGLLFGVFSVTRPSGECPDVKPRSVSVVWDRSGHGGGSLNDVGASKRHKVMAFVGIQTGFGSVGRRKAIRQTWLSSDRQGLLRLEEATGLAFRFVIGKTEDKSKMAALQKEVNVYDDFMLIDIEEEYSNLPHKTLAFFKTAFALYDSDFYVKADDDIYLRPDRLSLLLAKERPHTRTYLGCMKNGPVVTDPNMKWYEPLSHLFGEIYFLHAYGPIYALSADVVSSLVALRNDSFRIFSNEDVTIGSWMLAMNVNHENNHALCASDCSSSSIAVWDIPRCSGLCNPEVKMLELHKKEICSGASTFSDE